MATLDNIIQVGVITKVAVQQSLVNDCVYSLILQTAQIFGVVLDVQDIVVGVDCFEAFEQRSSHV